MRIEITSVEAARALDALLQELDGPDPGRVDAADVRHVDAGMVADHQRPEEVVLVGEPPWHLPYDVHAGVLQAVRRGGELHDVGVAGVGAYDERGRHGLPDGLLPGGEVRRGVGRDAVAERHVLGVLVELGLPAGDDGLEPAVGEHHGRAADVGLRQPHGMGTRQLQGLPEGLQRREHLRYVRPGVVPAGRDDEREGVADRVPDGVPGGVALRQHQLHDCVPVGALLQLPAGGHDGHLASDGPAAVVVLQDLVGVPGIARYEHHVVPADPSREDGGLDDVYRDLRQLAAVVDDVRGYPGSAHAAEDDPPAVERVDGLPHAAVEVADEPAELLHRRHRHRRPPPASLSIIMNARRFLSAAVDPPIWMSSTALPSSLRMATRFPSMKSSSSEPLGALRMTG